MTIPSASVPVCGPAIESGRIVARSADIHGDADTCGLRRCGRDHQARSGKPSNATRMEFFMAALGELNKLDMTPLNPTFNRLATYKS